MLKYKIATLLALGSFICLSARGQYFYKDIFRTLEANKQHQKYQSNGVRNLHILSIDAQKQPSPGFRCTKTFSPDYLQSTTLTQSFSTGVDHLHSFFDRQGRVVRTVDSSATSISTTLTYYNPSGKIDSLVFLSKGKNNPDADSLLRFNRHYRLRETHVFFYDTSGVLKKMERRKNDHLFSTVYFEKDSAGHVFKEYQKNNDKGPVYYYKYKNGMLTDVFHFNRQQQKMIPDYLFDYDTEGRLVKKTVVLTNRHKYLEWHYSYNSEGQISKQVCYDGDKKLQGSLIFKYNDESPER